MPMFYAKTESPIWVALEAVDCGPIRVDNPFSLHPSDRCHLLNPITIYIPHHITLQVWDTVKYFANLLFAHNPLMPFTRGPMSLMGFPTPWAFKEWITRDII